MISKIEATLDEHIEHLERHLKTIGGNTSSPVKSAVSAVAGVAAGLYDKVRDEQVSKMLRDFLLFCIDTVIFLKQKQRQTYYILKNHKGYLSLQP